MITAKQRSQTIQLDQEHFDQFYDQYVTELNESRRRGTHITQFNAVENEESLTPNARFVSTFREPLMNNRYYANYLYHMKQQRHPSLRKYESRNPNIVTPEFLKGKEEKQKNDLFNLQMKEQNLQRLKNSQRIITSSTARTYPQQQNIYPKVYYEHSKKRTPPTEQEQFHRGMNPPSPKYPIATPQNPEILVQLTENQNKIVSKETYDRLVQVQSEHDAWLKSYNAENMANYNQRHQWYQKQIDVLDEKIRYYQEMSNVLEADYLRVSEINKNKALVKRFQINKLIGEEKILLMKNRNYLQTEIIKLKEQEEREKEKAEGKEIQPLGTEQAGITKAECTSSISSTSSESSPSCASCHSKEQPGTEPIVEKSTIEPAEEKNVTEPIVEPTKGNDKEPAIEMNEESNVETKKNDRLFEISSNENEQGENDSKYEILEEEEIKYI
ncbi:hypothetical protein NCAS_0F03550 [Naumovozyma castellii]|uniref:Uncharacterized protein n=1 Tax=Naumovozyma castellii TaxID=27288 RepID=G0VH66_NAUCA|nr:hypothetical protein NCAS_0F03550 [Naumovozyma castellii CBS 4309]CCC70839.1 hypothetical protein NCAS_0F03550 [Naumovozyma castellii CBS 4309]